MLYALTPLPPVANREPIAIVGMGCRLPGSVNSIAEFWELLREGRCAIGPVPSDRWSESLHFDPDPQRPLHQHVFRGGFVDGIDQFDAEFFGVSPREAVCMDPQQRLLLEVTWQAMEMAGLPLERLKGTRTGVFVGISSSDYVTLLWGSPQGYRFPDNEPFVLPGNTGCIAANRLSYLLDLKGPSFTVDTACSSSLVAVHLACESLWRGESSLALAGGVQALIHPGVYTSFAKAGLLAPDGLCKSFDAAANGYVRSEGAGAVLLKPLAAAMADGDPVVAVIHGSAVNSDGRSQGIAAPNLRAQVACVREAFAQAGIEPAAAQYVEAHGTGTRHGDPIELRALGSVLREGRPNDQPCRVGSVKTNLGHGETAAGITGLIKAALCIQQRQLPPSLHFRTPNPSVDFEGLKLKVQTRLEGFPRPDAPAVVGVSSFGFGGTNAHVVLAELPAQPTLHQHPEHQPLPLPLLCLSARSESALRQQAARLAAWWAAHPELPAADVCATAHRHRSHFSQRLVCLGGDRAGLCQQLEAYARGGSAVVRGEAQPSPAKLAFLFTGQGSQSVGMARELWASHGVFREAFDQATALLDPLLERPLASVLYPEPGQEQQAAALLQQTAYTQPALFVVGYALSRLWRSWGIRPDLLMGHSVGELVAAHLAGVFSLEDGIKLVAARGRLMQALPEGGGMVALVAAESQVQPLLQAVALSEAGAEGLAISAINGVNTVVAGPLEALNALVATAEQAGIEAHPLAVSHAFHSPAMAPMLANFEQVLAEIRFSPPQRPLISNVSGGLAGAELATSRYWCEHVMSPVRFAQGLETLLAQGVGCCLELGAKPTLIGMARQNQPEVTCRWLPSLRPGQSDGQVLAHSLAELYASGWPLDWAGLHPPRTYRQVQLPGYAFQRQRYWWSGPDAGEGSTEWLQHIGRPLASTAPQPTWAGLQPLPLPGGSERRFSTTLQACEPEDLQDHRIHEQVVFPAAGFVQLALQAAQAENLPLALSNLELDLPLRLTSTPCAVQLVWTTDGMEFYSQSPGQPEPLAAPAPWRCHGRCSAGAGGDVELWQPLDRGAEALETLDVDGFYSGLQAFGLNYGPAFRCLTALQRKGDRAWAELRRTAGSHDWALLDGCFQAVAATLDPQGAAGQLLLPVGCAELQLEQLPLPDALSCQVQLCPSDDPAFVVADLLLQACDPLSPDQPGAVLGLIRGFRLRRLPRAALDWLFPQAGAAASWRGAGLVRAEWETIPAADPAASTSPAFAAPPPGLIRASTLGPDPLMACAALLQRVQASKPDEPLWLMLDTPAQPALSGALEGLAKAAALEQPQRQWLRVHVLKPGDETPLPWAQLQTLAAREPALAWDGRQLWRQRLRPLPPPQFRIAAAQIGSLESLHSVPLAAVDTTPAPGELELAVEATGLNFRDVLNALGVLRSYSRQLGLDDAAALPFGGECVGRVLAVGPGVDPGLVGTRMLAALAVGSLASHVRVRADLCVPLPPSLSPADGASVSTAFLTAIYGLQQLAQLQPGETVLIHAAAGGVGQAAVQVAKRLGARILATASAPKQQLLRDQGVEAVFDSRSLTFAEQVQAHTGGRGVDVVLNSLKGEWVDASFAALAAGGRFVELGKIEIWSRAEAFERRPDASYLPFDLLDVAVADPPLVRALLEQLLLDLAAGTYQLLPLQVFPIAQSAEAFRLMAQARHVGKVVIENPHPAAAPLAEPIRPDGSYLISGGLGALGLQLARWLADQGATCLLLLGRSADQPSPQAQQQLAALAERGVDCRLIACNLAASEAAAEQAEQQLAAALAALEPERPLRGVFHAAGVLQDGLLAQQTPQRFAEVMAPKLGGWQLLERVLTASEVVARPCFVVHFSSIAGLLGSPGQANYSAANAALDALAAAGHALGPQLSVQWGPWQQAGMAAALGDAGRQRLAALGVRALDPAAALDALALLLREGIAGAVGVLDVEWAQLARQVGPRQAAFLEPLLHGVDAPEHAPFRQVLFDAPALERQALLVQFVRQQLATVMGLADPQQIDPREPLFNMGLDSLMALELTALLEQQLGVRLTESLVFEHPSVEQLARHVLRDLLGDENASESASSPPPLETGMPATAWQDAVEQVATLSTDDLLQQLRGLDRP